MSREILSGIQIAISILEIWMCYELLYTTVLNKKYANRIEKIISWCNIILIGGILGVNRLVSFFSSLMFFIVVVITILCVWYIERKKILLIAGIILSYFTLVSILDFVLAFISIEFMESAFRHNIYVYAMTWQKEIIFVISRCIVMWLVVILKRKESDIRSIVAECKNILFVTGCFLLLLLLKYQFLLDGMVNGNKIMQGVNASVNLLGIVFVSILIGYFVFKYQLMKREKETLVLREQMFEERYEEMMQSRQLLHDMKNHLLVLRNLEETKKENELHDYLIDISNEFISNSARVWTGNIMIDLIVNSKELQAKTKGITFEINTRMIDNIPFSEREIISLFGNLLDNAIEACERMHSKDKWIYLKIIKQHQIFYIEIENSIDEYPIEKNGKLISNKNDKGIHGYGLKNVQCIVSKYDGTYIYQIKEDSFLTIISFFDNEDVS